MTCVDLRPTGDVRDIEVLVGGQWAAGELEAYRQDRDGTCRGWVRWSTGLGQNHLDWFTEEQLRKAPLQGPPQFAPSPSRERLAGRLRVPST